MDRHTRDCRWCRATARAASQLRFTRLGKHERRLLLAAGAWGKPATPILPSGPSHNDRTATRRAKDKLTKAGLLVVAADRRRVTMESDPALLRELNRSYLVLQFMTRSPLGEALVARFQRELGTPGARIRWLAASVDAVLDAALALCPERKDT